MKMISLLLIINILLGVTSALATRESFQSLFNAAAKAVYQQNYVEASKILEEALLVAPNNVDALQLYGALAVKQGSYTLGLPAIRKAVELGNWGNPDVLSNYIQALRLNGQKEEALSVAQRSLELFPHSASILANSAYAFHDAGHRRTLELFDKILQMRPENIGYWQGAIEAELEFGSISDAAALALRGTQLHPSSVRMAFYIAHCTHLQDRLSEALELYHKAIQINSSDIETWTGIGGVYQEMGLLDEAAEVYERIANVSQDDHSFLNNYGALLTNMNDRQAEGEKLLLRALELRPDSQKALTNLGTYYHDEGDIGLARNMFSKASASFESKNKGHNSLFGLRAAILLPQVPESYENMVDERRRLIREVKAYIRNSPYTGPAEVLDGVLDRTVFYLQYHGFNDKYIQELIAEAYRKNIVNFEIFSNLTNPALSALTEKIMGPTTFSQSSQRKIRVGFISKFFGVFEPHALLLDGVMRYLPRSAFEVIAFPVSRNDGKPLAPGITEGADIVIELSLNHFDVFSVVASTDLDILVFADTQSEPMTHFMCHHRIAPIQVAFWGNPITSASEQIDYFVSSVDMEHPYRTHTKEHENPYSEQVVLLDGQGIWYYRPDAPQLQIPSGNKYSHLKAVPVSRSDFGLADDWFIFFCPQSVFKMHPLFDKVFADILTRVPHAHLVVTGGRRSSWTKKYLTRIENALGPQLANRTHLIKRISSEKFLNLLRIADVLLHPFPFDGSRTSADGLGVGVPVLTLPTEYLRGRMCQAFYRTMDIPELVAKNRSHYVDVAAKLADDKIFYDYVRNKLLERSDLIWEDMEVPFMWSNFLARAVGLPVVSWNDYISQSGRNVALENELRKRRMHNRDNFKLRWGEETWLLREDGVAPLPTLPNNYEAPAIFSDWNHKQQDITHSGEGYQKPPTISSKLDGDVALKSSFSADSTTLNSSPSSFNISTYSRFYRHEVNNILQSDGLAAAIVAAREVYGVCREEFDYLVELGGFEYTSGNHDAAVRHCGEAVKRNAGSATAQGCLGMAALTLNQEDLAISSLAKSWRLLKDSRGDRDVAGGVFAVTTDALEAALLSALFMFRRYDECLDLVEEFLHLPILSAGGAHIILFALVNWSDHVLEKYLTSLESNLNLNDGMSFFSNGSFLETIRRLQRDHMSILPAAYTCLNQAVMKDDRIAVRKAYTDLNFIVRDARREVETFRSNVHNRNRAGRVVLLSQYFDPFDQEDGSSTSSSKDKDVALSIKNDIDQTLLINLNNPVIEKVFLFTDKDYDFVAMFGAMASKIIPHRFSKRATFQDMFLFANENIDTGSTVVLANSDVYFDETLQHVLDLSSTLSEQKTVLALSKWKVHFQQSNNDFYLDMQLKLNLRIDSQDSWIFSVPVSKHVVDRSDFYIGQSRCDNALASLFHDAGYSLKNPAFVIRSIEVDSRGRKLALYNNAGIDPNIISKWVLFSVII